MVGEPRLASFVFAPNPVTHQQAVAGVTIPLHHLGVHILAFGAQARVGVGGDRLRSQVELGYTRKMRQVESWTDGCVTRRRDRENVIVHFRIGVER